MRTLILFLLLASPCLGQQAIQKSVCGGARPTAGPCSFSQVVKAGDLLVAIVEGGLGVNGYPVSDSLGQTWKLGLSVPYNDNTDLYYVLNSIAGSETVSFPYDPTILDNCYAPGQCVRGRAWSIVLLEYPPALSIDTAKFGTYGNYTDSILEATLADSPGDASSDWNWTMPLQVSGYGELIIGYGKLGGLQPNCSFSAGPNFSIEALITQPAAIGFPWGGSSVGVEDMIATSPGLYFPSMQWSCYTHWTMGAVAFKMK
jgi:hypothetical protein